MDNFLFWWELLREGILASLAAAVVLPWVGALLYVRRSALLGIAVPQFSAAGLALGLLLIPLFPSVEEEFLHHGHPPMSYSFAFAAIAAGASLVAFAFLATRFREHKQAVMAAGFSIALAATALFLNAAPAGTQLAETLMRGEVILLDEHGMAALLSVSFLVLIGLLVLWRLFLVASYDPEQTVVLGHSVQSAERWQVLLVGMAVGSGVVTIGPMLVFALLFLPPVFAARGRAGAQPYLRRTLALSLVSISLSWPASILLDIPFGPTASLTCLVVGCIWMVLASKRIQK
ncbi:MAG: metal ABC transporter permease [Planctomycetota bacterium]|jgi:ABC-type Mn2+/Zn2+ transport system permease subunit|nr:metal ABC transporter permease [Planctomycetota bacterium]